MLIANIHADGRSDRKVVKELAKSDLTQFEKLGLKRNVWRVRSDISAFDEKTEL